MMGGIGMYRRMGAVAAALSLAAGASEAREIFVSNEKGNSITIVDGDKLAVVATVPVGNRPRGIALSPDGKWLYICASEDDAIEIMDTETRKILGRLPSGPDPELLD